MLPPRTREKREALTRLYLDGVRLKDIADLIGGTPKGVRSTIRKMRARGDIPSRAQPQRTGSAK